MNDESANRIREEILDSFGCHGTATAIDDGARKLSFAEVGRLAEHYAGFLDDDDRPVALVTDVHALTYILYLSCVLSGRTVVPVSPTWSPRQQIAAMTQSGAVQALRVYSPTRPDWSTVRTSRTGDGVDLFQLETEVALESTSWLYVLHTSGSTGAPKSVPVGASQVMSFLDYMIPRFDIGPGCQLSSTFDLAFDVAVFDLFGAILSGATMHVPQGAEYATSAEYVRRRNLTHWFSVPSVINSASLLGQLGNGSMPTLRFSLFAGEALTWNQVKMWRVAAPRTVIENVYGPTELALACSSYRVPPKQSEWPSTSNGTVPIGTVFPHLESRVGSSRNPHELMVRGPQRFAGYLRDLDNEAAFESDAPQRMITKQPVPESYWYRTGDSVRTEHGELVFQGRVDRQVKVNGARVELGEVEFAFLRQHGVHHASALVEKQAERSSLTVVLSGDATDRAQIEKAARADLPRYTWPRTVLWVQSMPLNSNGKVDHAAVRRLISSALPVATAQVDGTGR